MLDQHRPDHRRGTLRRGLSVTLGIRARLLAAFVAIALFTGVLGLYAVTTMGRLNEGQRTVYRDVFGGTHLLATWVDVSWEARATLLSYLLSEDAVSVGTIRDQMARFDDHLRDLARKMDEADTDREDVETLAGLMAAWDDYAAWRDDAILGQLARGDRAAALAAYKADGARLGATLDETIDAFLAKKLEVGGNLESDAEGSFDLTRRIAILLSVAAAGLGLVVGFFISRSIARGVGQVATAAEGLAVGDLDQRITLDSKDEIGQMAAAVRHMIAYQQEMARVADAMARGDLTQNVKPKGPKDQLGTAFQHMIGNLRALVGQLEEAVRRANQLAELAEEREARMRAVLDSVADAIITFDEQGRIETVNPMAERVFGYPAAELVGKDVNMLLGEARDDAFAIGTRHELAGRRRDQSLFPMDMAVSEMRLAERRLSIASVRDITERKQADARFRGLLESAPDAIVTANREGRIQLVNTQAERLFGYDRSELLGQMVEVLLPEYARAVHEPQRPRSLAAPGTRPMGSAIELSARRKDGSEFPVEISLSPLQAEDGVLATSVIRDITERKRAEAAQRFLTEASTLLAASLDYETTLASIARLVVPFLADGCIVEVVKEGEDPHALQAVALVEPAGARLSGQLGNLPEKVLRSGRAYLCARGEPPEAAEDQLGGWLPSLHEAGFGAVMVIPLVARGRPLGVISFVAAISGRQYGPKDLTLAEELAHRCALAIENARLYREAQSAIGLRDDFFSVASHELKTPVAALLAFTQFILKRAERQHGLTPRQMVEALEEVHWQSDRIARLVAQLLDTSRLDAGKLALDPELTDVGTLVRAAVRTPQANTRQHTISLELEPDTWATIDPIRFEQVVTNLVDNAIKYSPDGGSIEVLLTRPDLESLRLVVRDHGIGIPAEHQPYIFDRFYQAHAGQHFAGVAGMGLGLYISRRIVEMHGGMIQLDSPPDGGARVTVTVPVGATGSAEERRARRPRADTGSAVAAAIRAG